MATRALKQIQFGLIRPYTVASGQTVTVGKTVKFGATDTEVQDAGSGSDLAFGVVMPNAPYASSTGVIDPAVPPMSATQTIEVLLLGSVYVPMLVGTGGTTRGKSQKVVSDGITDTANNGGGTTDVETIGIALQSGLVGDFVGVLISKNSRVSA